MISLDTNVLVRLVARDDPDQLPAVMAIMRQTRLFVAKTVLVELAWVLRYSYQLSPASILSAFNALMGYPNLQVEDRRAVLLAVAAYARGLDFADALHLMSSQLATTFATFDRKLAAKAEALDLEPPVLHLTRGNPP